MNISRYWQSLLFIALSLAWSLPAEAVTIKQVLSGTTMMTSTPMAVTLSSSVNPTKSFVVCYNRTSTAATSSNPTGLVTCELGASNPTTALTITAGVADASEAVVWYVAEFSSGVTVQRGLATFGTSGGGPTAGNPTITAVNSATSFPIITTRVLSTDTSEARDEDWAVRAQLNPAGCTTSCTTLALDRNLDATTPFLSPRVAWQVITITDSAVQPSPGVSGNNTISSGSLTNNYTPTTAVDLTKTFVVFSRKASATVVGVESQYQARCGLCTTANAKCVTSLSTPTLSSTGGGSLAATTYYVETTYKSASGETLPSSEASLAVAANNLLVVNSPCTAPACATGWNVYVSTSSATETRQNGATPVAIGSSWTEPTSGLVSGVAPPTSSTFGACGTSSTVTCTRTVTGSAVTLNSFAVSLTDCSAVQSGNASTALATDTTLNVTLCPAIDPTKTVPFISVSGGASTNNSDLDDTSWTAAFTSCTPLCTNLQLQRRAATTNTNATVSWFVVQFPGLGATPIDKQESAP